MNQRIRKWSTPLNGNYFIVLGGYSVPYTSAAEFGEAFRSCNPQECCTQLTATEVNRFLAPSTRAPPQCISCPCATCIWLLHPAPILVPMQDGLDTVQLALVVFFLPPTSKNTPLAVMVAITCCNLRGWCFSLEH